MKSLDQAFAARALERLRETLAARASDDGVWFDSRAWLVSLDRTFGALADPTRRSILQLVSTGPASISELARPFGIALPTVLEHVRILEETRLLTTEKVGRVRECTLGPERLDEARRWIETFRMWERRLDALDRYVSTRSGRRA